MLKKVLLKNHQRVQNEIVESDQTIGSDSGFFDSTIPKDDKNKSDRIKYLEVEFSNNLFNFQILIFRKSTSRN